MFSDDSIGHFRIARGSKNAAPTGVREPAADVNETCYCLYDNRRDPFYSCTVVISELLLDVVIIGETVYQYSLTLLPLDACCEQSTGMRYGYCCNKLAAVVTVVAFLMGMCYCYFVLCAH